MQKFFELVGVISHKENEDLPNERHWLLYPAIYTLQYSGLWPGHWTAEDSEGPVSNSTVRRDIISSKTLWWPWNYHNQDYDEY